MGGINSFFFYPIFQRKKRKAADSTRDKKIPDRKRKGFAAASWYR